MRKRLKDYMDDSCRRFQQEDALNSPDYKWSKSLIKKTSKYYACIKDQLCKVFELRCAPVDL